MNVICEKADFSYKCKELGCKHRRPHKPRTDTMHGEICTEYGECKVASPEDVRCVPVENERKQ